MEKIIHKDGKVFLLIEHDVYGRHTTLRYLGKEEPTEKLTENETEKKTKKKKDEE